MFTGIVKAIGTVVSVERSNGGIRYDISVPLRRRWTVGESVLVDGVCSTVTRRRGRTLTFTYMKETCEKTTVSSYVLGTRVNIEPSLRVGDDLSGHILSGHVDARAQIVSLEQKGMMTRLTVRIPAPLARYVAPTGSIALDGVSLTVSGLKKNLCAVALIPYTAEHTTLGLKKQGEWINIEVDMMAKYVERLCKK